MTLLAVGKSVLPWFLVFLELLEGRREFEAEGRTLEELYLA